MFFSLPMFSGGMSDEIVPACDAVPMELPGWLQLNQLPKRSGKSGQGETNVQGALFSTSELNQAFVKEVSIRISEADI